MEISCLCLLPNLVIMTSKKIVKRVLFSLLAIVISLLVIVAGYLVYLLIDYDRLEDKLPIAVKEGTTQTAKQNEEYSILTYNIGFCAYLPDFGFFMDGGKESRAKSKESVNATLKGINGLIAGFSPDFIMLEEVDEKATRSYKINQRAYFENAYSQYDSIYAQNYDSSYLFYPIFKPHGKSKSGMLTFSRYNLKNNAIRRSLPIENSLMKFFDLDRCYSVTRVEIEGGKELVLFTAHLSAYTSDGKIADEQIKVLMAEMQAEYQKGNYVICGGDFNKDLLGKSEEYFGRSSAGQTWAQPFPIRFLEGSGFTLVSSYDADNPMPTCRNANGPYNEEQFVLNVDGFIVSANVEVSSCVVADGSFVYSDHNPVLMKFILK